MTQLLLRKDASDLEPAPLDTGERLLNEEHSDLVFRAHQRLLQEYDLAALERQTSDGTRQGLETAVRALVTEMASGLYGEAREAVVRAVLNEAIGLGPIQRLVDDESISEVMVNAPDEVYVERDGIIYVAPVRFRDDAHIMRIVDRIIAPLGRRVDESSPYVDARLPDGSRVNVIIPPLVPRSPTVTIRKFRPDKYTVDDLLANNTLTAPLAEFLRVCVRLRLNMVVSGGSGTGKTTMLNALSTFIPKTERIITIEDPIELMLQQHHVIAMEARPPSIEGRNEVTQRDLLRNALRMRPDRIIVGEVRGPEAFDMMQAMNTGHEGSLTTVHANSPRDSLARIENMVLMAGLDLPVRVIREQMASALHIVLQLARFSDGRRRVIAVTEITGMEGDVIVTQDLFRFVQTGSSTEERLEPTGIMPTFADQLARTGYRIDWGEPLVGRWGEP
ncbi:MAG: type II secretion system protein E [Chloroflexi bacterium RBG_16_68_14]|nr:MAG: type II secretion system protein E [Chloroflexi bacterium RBG_16_68_14]